MDNIYLQMEKDIMKLLLTGPDDFFDILREQYANAEVKSREYTGVGFFTVYQIKDHCRRVENRNFQIADGEGSLNEDNVSIGFVLFIREGKLETLEGFTYDDRWPEKIYKYKLWYTDNRRDYEALREKWKK